MTFERTDLGQANRALFFGADLTCYVEGSDDTEHGIDISFWSSAFEALAPDKRIHFTRRGGKPVVENLAADIVKNDVQNTIVAMDRDFSEFRERGIIDDHRVFYTFGYSWENDTYFPTNALKVASHLSRTRDLAEQHKLDLIDDYDRLDQTSRRFVFADFVAIQKGGSILNRSKPGRYTSVRTDGRPEFCIERVRQDLKSACVSLKTHICRPTRGYPRHGSRYLWGKALEHYMGIGIAKTVKACSGRAFTPDHLRDVAIAMFCHHLFRKSRSDVFDHYVRMWDRFILATGSEHLT